MAVYVDVSWEGARPYKRDGHTHGLIVYVQLEDGRKMTVDIALSAEQLAAMGQGRELLVQGYSIGLAADPNEPR